MVIWILLSLFSRALEKRTKVKDITILNILVIIYIESKGANNWNDVLREASFNGNLDIVKSPPTITELIREFMY